MFHKIQCLNIVKKKLYMDLEKFCDVYIASTNKCDVTGQN